jgi:hypothetical protein
MCHREYRRLCYAIVAIRPRDGNALVQHFDVVDLYSEGGRANVNLDARIAPRKFSPDEKSALVAFLRSLTGTVMEGP